MGRKLLKMLGLDKVRFYGKYRGIVKDNEDSKTLLRIKALVPKISKKFTLSWALPCTDLLGNNRGKFKVPAVGDGVWIEFEGGDPDYPIYSGMWCAKDDIPQDFIDNYGETYELDIDKNGNLIERSEAGIKVTDKNGNYYEMIEDYFKIVSTKDMFFEDGNGNKFTKDSNGMKMEDKNGNVIEMGSSSTKINDNFEVLQ